MRSTGRDQTLVRRVNELSLLEVLRRGDAFALSSLASATRLSWRTTSVVVESLADEGWLSEVDAPSDPQRLGRPARAYSFRSDVGHVLAIDIAAERVAISIADLAGVFTYQATTQVMPLAPAKERIAVTRVLIAEALQAARLKTGDIWAATLATSGVVRPDGVILRSVVLPGWDGLNLAAELAGAVECRITVVNDCDLAAVAEQWRGQRSDDLLYVLAGSRLGVGIVLNGRLHAGFSGAAGEIGEVVDLGWNNAARVLAQNLESSSGDVGRDASEVFVKARAGDASALRAVNEYAFKLARGIALMALAVDPEKVVIGGSFLPAADLLIPPIQRELDLSCISSPQVVASAVAEDAVALGAVRVALDAVDDAVRRLDTTVRLSPDAVRSSLFDALLT